MPRPRIEGDDRYDQQASSRLVAALCYSNSGVSNHSKAYGLISRGNVAQFEVRKTLIVFGNLDFGVPYFEPGGRRFESVRARDFYEKPS